MLELVMKTDLAKATPDTIEFNFEELKAELAERLDHYNNLVVTEDGIKEAKEDRAKLNKLRTAIDTRRKDIKKEYLKPYNEFEGKIKELTLLIDQPIGAIDAQLQGYEEKRKEEKLERIQETYAALVPEAVKEIMPLAKILDPKWLNATTAMTKVEEEIAFWSTRVNADLLALDTVEPEYRAAVRERYIATLNIAEALDHRDKLKAAEEAFKAREEAKRSQEEERIEEEEKRAPEPQNEHQEATPAPEEKRYTLRLEFNLTKAQAIALRAFIDQNQIQYRKF